MEAIPKATPSSMIKSMESPYHGRSKLPSEPSMTLNQSLEPTRVGKPPLVLSFNVRG